MQVAISCPDHENCICIYLEDEQGNVLWRSCLDDSVEPADRVSEGTDLDDQR